MKRIVARVVLALVVALAVVYLGDLAVWEVRAKMGSGMGRVVVSRFVVAPLKGGKEDYYFDGTVEVDCSRSIFPQAGNGACWWLERHKVTYDR